MSTQATIALQQAKEAAKRGDYSRARSILREAARYDPYNVDILILFAQVAQKREHAIQCYQRVLEIDPYNEIANRALNQAHAQQARRDDIQKFVSKAQSAINPEVARQVLSPLAKIPFKRWFVSTFRTVMIIALLAGGSILGYRAYHFINAFFGLGSSSGADETAVPVTTATPTIPPDLPLLQAEFFGRIFIMEGDPALFENVWELIDVDSFNSYAYSSENGEEYWYDAIVNLRVGFQRAHPVRFRLTVKNPSTGISTPVLLEETIVPNHELGIGANSLQVRKFSFQQFSTGGEAQDRFELEAVETVRIDGVRQEDWEPPEGGAGKHRDVWVISNPHAVALPIAYELVKRDQAGNSIGIAEYTFCTQAESSFESLYYEFSLLPPGEKMVITQNITPEEEQSGVTTELILRYPNECQPLLDHDVAFDPNLVLIEPSEESDAEENEGEAAEEDPYSRHLVVENRGTNEAFGLFYVNVYDPNDDPIAGRVIALDPSNFPLLPDEYMDLNPRLDFIDLVQPTPTRYEFIFLGMSQIGEQTTPAPLEGEVTPTDETTPQPSS